jgi:hypothetical protein
MTGYQEVYVSRVNELSGSNGNFSPNFLEDADQFLLAAFGMPVDKVCQIVLKKPVLLYLQAAECRGWYDATVCRRFA